MMTDATGTIHVDKVTEHEDGSATWDCEMNEEMRNQLAEYGLTLVLHCTAAEMNVQDVFDWLSDKVKQDTLDA